MSEFADLLTKVIADLLVIPIVLVGAVAMLRIPKKLRYQRIVRAIMTGLTALLLAKIASLLYQGQRPFVELGVDPKAAYLNNPGFPSDHVLLVFTIAFVVWGATKNTKLSILLACLGILVALGRVVALVHTPADVLGGIACAFLAAVIWYGKGFFSQKLLSSK